jgi:hypothetical protein
MLLCIAHAEEHLCDDARGTRVVDFNQDWGRMALPEDDFRMNTPSYKKFINEVAFCHSTATHTELDEDLTHKWQLPVDKELTRMTGDPVTILALTSSGSDANNLLVDLAAHLVNKDVPEGEPARRSCVLVMREGSAAARGYLAHFSSRWHFASMYRHFRPAELTDEVRSLLYA